MAGAGDIARIISQINQLIPNMEVKEDNILRPTHEFVRSFCELALNYYDRKVGYITTEGEQPLVNTPVNYYMNLGYGPEIAVFVRIQSIINQVCNSANTKFTVIDFYKPSKQRTKAFLSIILNFLLYVDNEVQNTRTTVEQCMQKIGGYKELEGIRNNLLETINNKVITRVTKQETVKKLEAELAACNIEYHEMLEQKKKNEEHDEQVRLELEKYQTVLNEKNDLLKRLAENVKDLRKKIVVPEQLLSVDAMEEQLKQEQDKINEHNEDYDAALKLKQKDCEYYSDTVCKISALDFDCLNILNDLKAQQSKIKEMQQKCVNLSTQIRTIEKDNIKTKNKISETEEKKRQFVLQKEKLKESILKSIKDQTAAIEKELNNIQELKKNSIVMKETLREREKILSKCKAEFDTLVANFEEQYKRALKIQNNKVTRFQQMLDDTREALELLSRY